MEKEKILQADMLDILFEGRNKEYGAYDLRKTYNRRMVKALMVTGSVVVLVLGSYFISAKGVRSDMAKLVLDDSVVLREAPLADPVPPSPPPPKIEVPQQKMIKFETPKIVPDVDVDPEDVPPVNDAMDDAKIGNETHDGAVDIGVPTPPSGNGSAVTEAPVKPQEEDIIFRKVEIESEYPGGMAAWARYLNKNLHVPDDAFDNGFEGAVIVQFVVDQEGRVSDVQVVSGNEHGALQEEAVRVIRKSGLWVPAVQNGRKVKSYKRQPIAIKFERE